MKTFASFFITSLTLLLIVVLGSLFFSCATAPPAAPPEEQEEPLPVPPTEEQEEPAPAPQKQDVSVPTPWPGKARAAVSLTFDDGTLDHYTTIFPILEEYGLRGTFFLIAGVVDQGFWQDGRVRRLLLSWDQAREMAAAGHEMGTQGYNHRNMRKAWRRGSNAKLVDREFRQAKQKIEREVGVTVESYAWPYWRTPEAGIASGLEHYKLLRSGVVQEEKYYQRYGSDPMMPGEPGKLLSFALLPEQDPETWKRIGNWIRELGGWWILCIHGITSTDGAGGQTGWKPLEEAEFRNFLEILTAAGEDFWIAPVGEVFRHVEASGEEKRDS